jgi:uroporphyrinogen-III decarboxylase
MGGPPASLLIGGTPTKVWEYMKSLLDDLKPGGGFVVNPAVSGIPDDAKPENVRAMTDAVLKYGVY